MTIALQVAAVVIVYGRAVAVAAAVAVSEVMVILKSGTSQSPHYLAERNVHHDKDPKKTDCNPWLSDPCPQ